MTFKTLKIAGLSIVAVGLTTGAAFAGGGKDCKDKTSASHASSMTAVPATSVLSASETTSTRGAKKVYTFDQALEACTAKGAADLQACIDYKTGKVTAKPSS